MAQRKKTTTITEILPTDNETPSTGTESVLGVSDFNVVLTKVHRILPNGKRAFAFQSSEEVDEITIQERYPQGGSFGVERFNDLGQSIERVVIDIDAKPMIGNPAPSGTSSVHDLQIQLLMNELSWMRQTMTNMIQSRHSESTPIGELVQAVQGMHGMIGGKDPMDLFIKGMDMATKFKNGGMSDPDWKTSLIEVVKENALPAIQAFTMMTNRNAAPAVNGNGEQQMRIAKTPEQEIREGIAWLKKKILGGLTPDLAVEWIVNNANDPSYQPIISTAINGGIDAFIALDAEIGNEPFKTWFTTAIEDLKGIYAEQSTNNDADMDGRNGNGADVTGNAKSRAPKSAKPKVV